MQKSSLNAVVIVLAATFVTLGSAQLVDDLIKRSPLKVRFHAGISHPLLLGGQQQTAFIKIDLTGFTIERESKRTPVNVALVLDKSGSMNGQKMDRAIAASVMAIDYLKPGDVVSVIAYDSEARVLVPATQLTNKSIVKDRIRSLSAGGGTALYSGVVLGAQELREFLDPSRVNRVILLSDGQANNGPSSPSELGDLGAALIEDGISVTTIGLGLGYNEDLMTQLAWRSDGNHSFVEDAENLAVIFEQEFGDVLSVVAQDVDLSINCADGIRPVRVLGREAEIDGRRVTVALNQLYADQDKYVLLEIQTDPSVIGTTDEELEVADVVLSYANMVTQGTDRMLATVRAQITESEALAQENLDKKSMAAVVQQKGILNEERAIELRDQGLVEEAEAVLRENAAYFERSAELFDEEDLSSYAEKSRQAIGNLEGNSWNQQRKEMRSDHYRAKVQQRSN